jgi:6-phosphofructokinase 1
MHAPRRIAVLTSGGDAAGMNAAVRGVTRAALVSGIKVFGVYEGLQGLVDGGDRIRALTSADVSGVLQRGGTFLGTARSADFRTRDGLRRAAGNLVERGIDGLVVIGGDGSLSGADELRFEWPGLLAELVAGGRLEAARAEAHQHLALVGFAGSIDNDMFGTDMTIGADTALHRITEAVDAIQSTASSHQRTFVIEVMGRHCGYLALMGGIAAGANFVLLPENPPGEGWQDRMCELLGAGRSIGRRASIVLVAEGAHDRAGRRITVDDVKSVLADRLGEDVRVTILGHVQRGGAPSAFDRYLGTVLGHAAVDELLTSPGADARVIGIEGQRTVTAPLVDAVARTRSVATLVTAGEYAEAMRTRGRSFTHSDELLRTLVRARPRRLPSGERSLRLGILHSDEPAPGMNAAVRVALRVGMDRGHEIVGVRNGYRGLGAGEVAELGWMTVSGWVALPGAELGTARSEPTAALRTRAATAIRDHRLDGLLMIGGWGGYNISWLLTAGPDGAERTPVPIVCVPASINNDLPGTDLSIGADTALNSIVSDVDKIKESAVASLRCFVVEVMGHDCGYLPLMGGLATGAECVYLPEEGITLDQLRADLEAMRTGFEHGKRRGLVIRGEDADVDYTTPFIQSLFSHESGGQFDVRSAILGHVQQGGAPSPFDRIHATRLAAEGIELLIDQASSDAPRSWMVGVRDGELVTTPLAQFRELVEPGVERPAGPSWWMDLRAVADAMAQSHPGSPRPTPRAG